MTHTVVDLRNYLIKGCQPHILRPGEELQVTKEGPLYQRQWMVVDAAKQVFRSQRHRGFERLTLLEPSLAQNTLHLRMEGDSIAVPIDEAGPTVQATIWEAVCPAIVHEQASQWLSDQLHQRVLLVRKNAQRPINSIYAPEADSVGFADRFPLTLLSTNAVARIKAALGDEINADRFRYNILFTDSDTREEHHLARFRIGSLIGRGVKPCGRCNTINVDQATAIVDRTVFERLQASPDFLNPHSGEIVVAENAIVELAGVCRIGDTVETIERRAEGWDRPYTPNHRRLPAVRAPLPER